MSASCVYTMGYQSLSLDEFLSFLVKSGIKCIIDIRNNPISRKPGFSKKRLSQSAEKSGMEYVHLGKLGIESSKRKNLKTEEDYKKLLDGYEESLNNGLMPEVENAAALAQKKPSVFVCFESEPHICHRSRLTKVIEERLHIPFKHLSAR
jgi:uncharacterized protein (DUF488 family)